jgi:uncharacterized protein (DUF2249 family)
MELIITPKTKVLDIITNYPALEEELINYVPAFEKLKNPLLRHTVAKVATLQQAATIGNVNVSILVNHLRTLVGQNTETVQSQDGQYNYIQPEWFSVSKISQQFDVREMLNRGEHPVAQVMEDLKQLPEGSIYKLTASFLPVPLIDKASAVGFKHWILEQAEEVIIYFKKSVK